MFSLICDWINGSLNNGETGDLRRHLTRYDVIAMIQMNERGVLHQLPSLSATSLQTSLILLKDIDE